MTPASLLLAMSVTLVAGCTGTTTPYQGVVSPSSLGQVSHVGETSPITAISAKVVAGHLNLTYQVDGEVSEAQAQLDAGVGPAPPVVALTAGSHPYPPDTLMDDVVLQPESGWRTLLRDLQEQITPRTPGEGAMLDVLQEEELLLYYDELGELRTVPMVYKPREVRPVVTVRLTALLKDAVAAQAARFAGARPQARYLLFDTGDTALTGYPFLLMDLDTGAVYFLQSPLAAPQGDQVPRGTGLHLPLYTMGSQLTSVWTRPFSSVARLFTGVASTAADTLRPRSLEALQGRPIPPLNQGSAMDLVAWKQQLDELLSTPAVPGRLRYLVDGDAFFSELIHAIDTAERSISLRLYIFDNDDYAVKIADLLKRRSRDIEVRILLDGLGTVGGGGSAPAYSPAYFQGGPASIVEYLQQDSGIKVRVLPNPWLQGDHTKAIVIDGGRAYIGGMNIAREYRYEWHDLMIEATGPVVEVINDDFEQAWRRAGPLGEWAVFARRRDVPAVAPRSADHPVRVLYTRTGRSEILTAQIAAIRSAQRRIYIQNAYFSSDAILYELAKARRRGVDVRVILPLKSDFGVMSRSNAVAANAMLANGIRVFVYPRMSHVKGAVYDGWACFGSANFDRLSLRLNKELNLATSDPVAVQEFVDQVFEPDFTASVELTEPLPLKWMDYLMELIADQL
jgi:cardiolipin synthase